MLNQLDIDRIKQRLSNGEEVYLYYAAHNIELREGILDETIYKSVNKFRAVKIRITDINNAYFELMRFEQFPLDFHTEEQIEWYDAFTKYIHYYTVPNSYNIDSGEVFYTKMPSIVYGHRRKIFRKDEEPIEMNDPSPVVPLFTNNPSYLDLYEDEVKSIIASGLLNWKYLKLDTPLITDGIPYTYVTSDYYILDIADFPRTEKPLINVNQKCAYFLDLCDCLNYITQLEA